MTADRDQHGLTADDLARQLAEPDETHELLIEPETQDDTAQG